MLDGIVYIGRFQPFHLGHLNVVRLASKLAKKVLIVIGSAYSSRNIRNPFTFFERAGMIGASLKAEGIENYLIESQGDHPYSESRWLSEIKHTVDSHISGKIGIIGYEKDHSSYYLKLFPEYEYVNVADHESLKEILDSTTIREKYFTSNRESDIPVTVPKPVFEFLSRFIKQEEFKKLQEEFYFVSAFKNKWRSAPYPPTFITVDAVVISDTGNILLIERGKNPGKGLLALPGGFVKEYEKIETATHRELLEETGLDLSNDDVVDGAVYTYPYRSTRGRTVTFATHFKVMYDFKVKAADDAASAGWYKLDELREDKMYEDHYHIVKDLLSE